jgi:hypothetical protein
MTERRPVVETLKDEHGNLIEIYSYHDATDDCPATAQTNSGAMLMSDVEKLRLLATLPPEQREGTDSVDLRRLMVRRDPGANARERVLTRGQKVKRAVVRTYILIISAVVLLVAGAAGYGYYEFTKPGKRMVDFRTCSFVDEKLGVEITGKREFSYLERSLFGVHFRLDKDIEQKTIIDIKGDPITVVGINKDGSWWNKFADMGERGVMILPQADQYVFATKKKAPVVSYEQFCR